PATRRAWRHLPAARRGRALESRDRGDAADQAGHRQVAGAPGPPIPARTVERLPRRGRRLTGRRRSSRSPRYLEAEIAQFGRAVRAPPERPVILAVRLRDGQIVDAGQPHAHQAVVRELPVLVAERSIPVPGVVGPLVAE